MSAQLIKEVEKHRHNVLVDVYSPTWSELLNQYSAGDIEVDPIYQRAFRWDNNQQSQFIESLLLNIPTPPIFLAEKSDGKFEVIDGLQRFSTMVRFFCQEIFKEEDIEAASSDESENNILLPTVLSEPPILSGLDGKSRETMPEALIRTLRYSRAQVILLKKESSPVAKYNVFTRLNRAGSNLSDQEIRNCSARLFNGEFADQLREIAAMEEVIKAMALSKAESVSMAAEENILRLLAFSHADLTSKKIADFLDEFMYKASTKEFVFTNKQKTNVQRTFEIIAEAYPKGEAFRFYKNDKFSGGFSTNLFDIVACGIYKNIGAVYKRGAPDLREKIKGLHGQAEALDLTGAGSNTRRKMVGRVAFGKNWFA